MAGDSFESGPAGSASEDPAGVPLRIVARRAGHANTTTTSTIYSHAIQSMDEAASDAIEDILKPKMGGARGVGG